MSKLLYSKDDEIPVVHIADVPPKEHPLFAENPGPILKTAYIVLTRTVYRASTRFALVV